jgi:hypothetical protein
MRGKIEGMLACEPRSQSGAALLQSFDDF